MLNLRPIYTKKFGSKDTNRNDETFVNLVLSTKQRSFKWIMSHDFGVNPNRRAMANSKTIIIVRALK